MVFGISQIGRFVSRRLGHVAKEIPPPPPRLTFDTHQLHEAFSTGVDTFVRKSDLHGQISRNEQNFAKRLGVGDWGGFYGWGSTNTPEKAMASTIRALEPKQLTHAQMKMLMQGNGTDSLANLINRNTLANQAKKVLERSQKARENIGTQIEELRNSNINIRRTIDADVARSNAPVPEEKKGLIAGIQRFFRFKN